MMEYLTFNKFLTPFVMIFFYYAGALGIPLFLLFYSRDFLSKGYKHLSTLLSIKNRWIFSLSIIFLFFCMELCWRMIFELIIAYFDMHDSLSHIEKLLEKGTL